MRRELILEKQDYEIINPILEIQEKYKAEGWKPEYAQTIKQCVSSLNEVVDEVNKEIDHRNKNKIVINSSFIEFYTSIYRVFANTNDERFLDVLVKETPELFGEIVPKVEKVYEGIRLNCKTVPAEPKVPFFVETTNELADGTYNGIPIEELIKNAKSVDEYLKEFARENPEVLNNH